MIPLIEALKCWKGYKRVKGKTPGTPGSCKKIGEGYKLSPEKIKAMRANLEHHRAERERRGLGPYKGSGAKTPTTLPKENRNRRGGTAGEVARRADRDIENTGRTLAPGSN
jgi:hypothetical protein